MVLACVIFLAEVCVVTIGTLRIIFISRGCKYLTPFLGFFEVVIWLFSMVQIMSRLEDWTLSLAFALGFTLGNYLGILLEKALALGMLNVHVITQRDSTPLLHGLRGANFGATCVKGQGATGPVDIIMTVIRRKQLFQVLAIIRSFDPHAFYAIDDLQMTSAGIFPLSRGKSAASLAFRWHVVSQVNPQEMEEVA